LLETLGELGVNGDTEPGHLGIWGRSGQLVAVGLAVRHWVAYHGAFVNVSPAMNPYGYIDTAVVKGSNATPHGERRTMSCLLAERGRAVTMTRVRSLLISSLATAFECDRYHLHTGHPLLTSLTRPHREFIARAS
jgi:lipoyl(octanoyl) transferase